MKNYKENDWIRFFSNSLRYEGATTPIGKVTKIYKSKENTITGYRVENATMIYESIHPFNVIEKIDIEKLKEELRNKGYDIP
jgi:hypothetical protein